MANCAFQVLDARSFRFSQCPGVVLGDEGDTRTCLMEMLGMPRVRFEVSIVACLCLFVRVCMHVSEELDVFVRARARQE